MSKDEKIQEIISKIEKHLKEIKKLCKTETLPAVDVKKLESASKSVNEVMEKSLQKMEEKASVPLAMSGPKRARKSKAVSKRKPSSYTDFVKKHMKDKDISALPVTERMSVIAEMWRASK